jgi:hypothetical protein
MSTPRLPWDDDVPEALDLPAPADPAARREPPSTPVLDDTPAATIARGVNACVHGAAVVRLAAVRRHVLAHRTAGVRVLAPTHDHAHDVVRHVLADVPASLGVERGGWVGFSVRLATPALIAGGLTPISGLGFEALVARVVARARAEGVLAYFTEASRHPGFVPSLARTLADVRLAGIAPARLDRATPKSRDLAWLLDGIETSLRELGYVDRAEVLRLAAVAVRDASGRDVALPLVLVDPPLSSRRDLELARALLARST